MKALAPNSTTPGLNSSPNPIIFDHTLVLTTQIPQFVPVTIPGRDRRVYFKVHSTTLSPFFLAILRKSQCEESDWKLIQKGFIVGVISTPTEPSDNDSVSYFIYLKSVVEGDNEEVAENTINIIFSTDLTTVDTIGGGPNPGSPLPLPTKVPSESTLNSDKDQSLPMDIPNPLTIFKIGSFNVTKNHIIWALIIALTLLVYYFFIRPIGSTSKTVGFTTHKGHQPVAPSHGTSNIDALMDKDLVATTSTSSTSPKTNTNTSSVNKEATLYPKISPLLEPKATTAKSLSISISPEAFTFSDVQQKELKELVSKIG